MSNWVIRPVPKDIQNEDKNSTLSFLLYHLRLVAYDSHYNFQVIGEKIFVAPLVALLLCEGRDLPIV